MLTDIFRRIRWAPTILITTAILWLTLAPNPLPDNDTQWFEGADKLVHGIMFFSLTFFFLLDLSDYKIKLSKIKLLFAATAIAVFASIDEWAQGAMGLGRSSDLLDLLADCIGIIVAAAGFILIEGKS